MQHQARGATARWGRSLLAAALLLASAEAGLARNYYGQDSRFPSSHGDWEGSHLSTHWHGSKGFHSYPGNFHEGYGPAHDHGHAGEVRKYGRHADVAGHWQAGYVRRRDFLPGGYQDPPDRRLFHYRRTWGEH